MTTRAQEDLALARRRLDDLARAVRELRRTLGDTYAVRRLCDDVERARASLGFVREAVDGSAGEAEPVPTAGPAPIEVMSDLPYDPGLFAEADDEGVGGMRPPRRTGR
ncbi:hypothetical protein [Embleya sp. NBC_00896]|uniref:hypothetical protein n=1 Tax=Embleya sp. NBC_00896 TaxID=2975961 RepID=UPI003863B46B|nr:hypothetical protein OG928_20615 [Embleya sp. NBC_00896]